MKRVGIIGAGLSGLVTAHALTNAGVDVTVCEATAHVGGPVRSTSENGFVIEHGPQTIMTSRPELMQLLEEIGLASEVVQTSPAGHSRFVVKDGVVTRLPGSPPALLKSNLYGWNDKAGLIKELTIDPFDGEADESVTQFVERRLGKTFLSYGLELLVNGVWAGNPDHLSARHAFSKMWGLERKHGSLIRGALAKRGGVRPKMIGLLGGNGRITESLAGRLSDLRLNTPAKKVDPQSLTIDAEGFDAIVVTAQSPVLESTGLIVPDVPYPTVGVISLGYKREQISHALDGFGFISPYVENRDILGALFCSSMFDHRAPKGHALIANFVGGARRQDMFDLSVEDRLERVKKECADLLGISGEPIVSNEVIWPRAIPQFNVGYGQTKVRLAMWERKYAGAFLAGGLTDGIAIPDIVAGGYRASRRVLSYLNSQHSE